MRGTRENWTKLLPIIQAFINNEPIQYLDYDNRWVDVKDELYSLLGREFRFRPKDIKDGVWYIEYDQILDNKCSAKGLFAWVGTNHDKPKFPKLHNCILNLYSLRFVEN